MKFSELHGLIGDYFHAKLFIFNRRDTPEEITEEQHRAYNDARDVLQEACREHGIIFDV